MKPLTTEEFHNRLLYLLQKAQKSGLCPLCCALDLITAADAIRARLGLTVEQVISHRSPPVPPAQPAGERLH